MVRTRRSSETTGFTSDIREIRRDKCNEIREDDSSDESGLDANPMSAKRQRLLSKDVIVKRRGRGRPSKHNQTPDPNNLSPLKTRLKPRLRTSERNEVSGATTTSRKRDETPRRPDSKGKKHLRNFRTSIDENPKLVVSLDDNGPSIRRSCRERRGVYDTLNVQMLTDHRFSHPNFENVVNKKDKRRRKGSNGEENSDSECEEEGRGNMYDLVKRKHDTPSPEKQDGSRNEEDDDSDDDDDDDNDEDEDEDNGEDEDEDAEEQRNPYLLRKKKPTVNRYTAPPIKKKKPFQIAMRRGRHHHEPPPHASPIRRYRPPKRKAMNMSSSTSSDGSSDEKDERMFERRKSKSMAKARNRALPINLTIEDVSKGILRDRERIGSSLADVDPMSVDKKIMFDSVGGLGKQIRALKEMILFPLVYPEVFEKFKITPPRGVLFFGPPGTGKTLVARALANECSQGDKKVSFFMRKGADCLSKWVGESERQLRLLFDQAYAMRPSIIFFDEIDGLAPVRSSRQDQIHSSIVSTLLALMDGLDSRGEVVVIGATNRVDAIDPALRRPGRFDREFQFPLPDRNARRTILSIHTKEWDPKLSQSFVNELADFCVGYCGADIKALCTEAALFALRRSYPQVYSSNKKLLLDIDNIEVTYKDFLNATKSIVPAHQRSVASPARVLSGVIKPLLENTFSSALETLGRAFPPAQMKTAPEQLCMSQHGKQTDTFSDDDLSSDGENGPDIYDHTNPSSLAGSTRSERYMRRMMQREVLPNEIHKPAATKTYSFTEAFFKGPVTYRPRLLLAGAEGMGQSTHLAPALLHSIEHLGVHCLDLPALYGVTSRTPEEACAQLFREARRTSPSVVYMPHLSSLWLATNESLHATLLSLLLDLPPLVPVLLLATSDRHFHELPPDIQQLFSQETGQVLQVCCPNADERRAFFHTIFMVYALQMPKPKKKKHSHALEVLAYAPSPPTRQLSEAELKKIHQNEENTMRELRIFLRDVHHKLIMDRRFKEFSKPVDLDEVDDYLNIVDEPMDLSTMMEKIDRHLYTTCAHYLLDVDLITSNALKYNPDRDPLDKIIRHRACELRDMAHSLIKSQLEPEFEKACEEIVASRERRGEKSSAVAPAYVFTAPRVRRSLSNQTTEERPQPRAAAPSSAEVPQSSWAAVERSGAAAATSPGKGTTSSSKSSKKKRNFGWRRKRYRGRQLKDELDKEDENKGIHQSEVVFVDDKEVGNKAASALDESMESYESLTEIEPAVNTKPQDSGEERASKATESLKCSNGDEFEGHVSQDELIESINKELLGNDFEHLSRNSDSQTVTGERPASKVIQNGEVHMSSDEEGESLQGDCEELPTTGHYGKGMPTTTHNRTDSPSLLHDGKDVSNPIHDGTEVPSLMHDGKEVPNPMHDGKEVPSPMHDGMKVPSPLHDGKEVPSPMHDGKNPPIPGQDAQVSRDCDEETRSAKRCVKFAESNGLPNGLNSSACWEHSDDNMDDMDIETRKEEHKEAPERLAEELCIANSDAEQAHGNEAELRWKHNLEQLLTRLVDMTAGLTVETLERYHNTLQLCIHQHRNNVDKDVLIQEFENTITKWSRTYSASLRR